MFEVFSEAEAMARLKFNSLRAFRGFLARHPYYRKAGRAKIFTEADLAQLFEAMPCPKGAAAPAGPAPRTSAEAALWARVEKMQAAKRKPGKRGEPRAKAAIAPSKSVVVALRPSPQR
jgi:hypothetical protein